MLPNTSCPALSYHFFFARFLLHFLFSSILPFPSLSSERTGQEGSGPTNLPPLVLCQVRAGCAALLRKGRNFGNLGISAPCRPLSGKPPRRNAQLSSLIVNYIHMRAHPHSVAARFNTVCWFESPHEGKRRCGDVDKSLSVMAWNYVCGWEGGRGQEGRHMCWGESVGVVFRCVKTTLS